MNIFNAMHIMETSCSNSYEDSVDATQHTPTFVSSDSQDYQEQYSSFRTRPVLYNIDGYISPYSYNNWGNVTGIMSNFDEEARLPHIEQKVDPNKIFTSDIAALRTLAADQIKITKLFEKRLVESLRDRDKYGLNEGDIMAMQALTAARSAVTAINKEQINIKKNIADLRIKQQTQTNGTGKPGTTGTSSGSYSSSDIGREIMDNLFNMAGAPVEPDNQPYNVQPVDLDNAANIIDGIVSPDENDYTQFEALQPQTFVEIDQMTNDAEYATYSMKTGELIPDFQNPTAPITDIDRESGKAKNLLMEEYPIRLK